MAASAALLAGKATKKFISEYIELVGEVVFEMAFDNMFRLDKSERPLGGGSSFIGLMTFSVLTSVVLQVVAQRAYKIGESLRDIGDELNMATRLSIVRQHDQLRRIILALRVTALGLATAQQIQRIPVMMALMA